MSKILILEDDIDIAAIERDYLELSGYEVVLCTDGTKGLRLALEESYDLLLLDVMLPGTDGFTICRAVREKKDIPILISSVTDPESAKLVQKNTAPGGNVTGTSDLTPCAAQIDLLKKIVPNAKTVGMLYCSSEQNSYFQIALAKAACDKLGLKYIDGTVSNANEIQQVVSSLCGKVDAIYSPTDNMIAAGMTLVSQVANESKIPVICGEEGMVKAGGLATYGINYYELGKQTAKMAVEILRDGKNPAEMPIEYLQNCDLTVNPETEKALGITVPRT